jgi:uncharacterized protein YoxC
MSNVESQYNKLKELMEAVKDVSERMKTVNLHEAEMAMKGNAGEALDNIERNLFVMRARILSELTGIIKNFGMTPGER